MILHIRKFRIIPYEVGPRTFSKKKKFNLKKKKKKKRKKERGGTGRDHSQNCS